MATYRKLGDKTNTVYMDGKPKKDKVEDYSYYLDIQIYSMADCVGQKETIKYLQDKIQTIKKNARWR